MWAETKHGQKMKTRDVIKGVAFCCKLHVSEFYLKASIIGGDLF